MHDFREFNDCAPQCNPYHYTVESKILKIHSKIFSISSLVKMSIT